MTEVTKNLGEFLEKLKKDGVDAGRAEGEKIKDLATCEAEKIINEARTKAELIISEAKKEASEITVQRRSELELAARDVLLSLRQNIARTVSAILEKKCVDSFQDPVFLSGLIQNVVSQYVAADLQGKNAKLVVPDLTRLADSLVANLTNDAAFQLKDGLKGAGFEFSSQNGTLEITAESVTEVLASFVNQELQELLHA